MKTFGKHPVRQIAYFVPDVEAAARHHGTLFDSGPYFVAHNIPLSLCEYRGQPGELDHSSAYGQWGDVMLEFIQQNNPGPFQCCLALMEIRWAEERSPTLAWQ